MNAGLKPLVSVVTPVYNGANYLADCIESVLEQTYNNWEYIIVDNCSTDSTSEIAARYARQDDRIKVVRNKQFVGVIENHNIAFQLISKEGTYCKVVSADDYLLPECLHRLLEFAECNPGVAIVGSYAISNRGIREIGLPPHVSVFCGREICRRYLRGAIDAFGTPSTVLYRSAVVRAQQAFYPGRLPNADFAACLICLDSADFGFVHQILSYERIHDNSISADIHALNGFLLDRLQFLYEYGPIYLTPDEIEKRKEELLSELYKQLAIAVVHLKGERFWSYHRQRLEPLGYHVCGVRMTAAVFAKLADLFFNPKQTIERLLAHLRVERCASVGGARGDNTLLPGKGAQGTGV